ncbi:MULTISPECIES: PQQ-dependent sugar dehydrogenase [Kocuria]|uniref:PQQ-dependent sugar dehydrogenase n=1 Tax=Kocuria subflava TaxID=1736139 RepID=A0A846U4E5_9MICC|nr:MULTISPECIES: PQQ-dependent sugar dehydrogenase [Kocuria]NKE09641.1 PQQ-dependent sugar dehydrogenase [Kocuria subflava]
MTQRWRTFHTSLACLTVAGLGLVACGDGGDGAQDQPTTSVASPTSEDPSQESPSFAEADAGELPFAVEEMGNYDSPWALEFLPNTEQLLITTITGDLILRETNGDRQITVDGVPEPVVQGQGGLGDIVLGPNFEQDRTVYLSWVEDGDGGTGAVIGRATLEQTENSASLGNLEVIWEQQPKTSGNGHFSHRMAFSPDGEHLYVSSGDRQKMEPAQDVDSGLGKILRLTPDGDPAPGNPFADRGGVSQEIYSYGHRNPLGLAFAPDGTLWSSEMGPQGGDELNVIRAGENYGWPEASNGSHYGGDEIPDHSSDDEFTGPVAWWTPSVSPAGLMIYDGDTFPQFQGDAFMGALSGQALVHVQIDDDPAVAGEIWDMGSRIRDVAQAPDGSIWVVEDGDDAKLLRLTPPEN